MIRVNIIENCFYVEKKQSKTDKDISRYSLDKKEGLTLSKLVKSTYKKFSKVLESKDLEDDNENLFIAQCELEDSVGNKSSTLKEFFGGLSLLKRVNLPHVSYGIVNGMMGRFDTDEEDTSII